MDETPQSRLTAAQEMGSYLSTGITFIVMAVLMFWPAGTIDWRRGWLFLALFIVMTVLAMMKIRRDNPELLAVRQKFQEGTKSWDAVVVPLALAAFAAILPVAALDDARFHWAPMPDWVTLVGYVVMGAGYWASVWAMDVNRHFETTVRIQTDRGHKLIDTGPYAYIRHPGYAFGILMAIGIALSLGSLFALIPVVIVTLLLAGRTLAEEAVLREGLPGYTEYAQRVKWRWLPFVW